MTLLDRSGEMSGTPVCIVCRRVMGRQGLSREGASGYVWGYCGWKRNPSDWWVCGSCGAKTCTVDTGTEQSGQGPDVGDFCVDDTMTPDGLAPLLDIDGLALPDQRPGRECTHRACALDETVMRWRHVADCTKSG